MVLRLLEFQGTVPTLNWLRWKDEGLREQFVSHGDLLRKLCALKKRISHGSLLPIVQPTEKENTTQKYVLCQHNCLELCSILQLNTLININLPGGHSGVVDVYQHQVTVVHDFSAVLNQLLDVRVSHDNSLRDGKCPAPTVLWPIPGLGELHVQFQSHTL